MAGSNPLYYWDTCLFLAWLKDETRKSGEMAGVREIIERSKRRDCRIMTSVLTSVEVLQGKIPAGFDTLFNGLLKRTSRVGVDVKVAGLAHDIRNHLITSGGSRLKTPDALHLASAILHRADEFHTFDDLLISLSGNVAGHKLIICKPEAKNPELDLNPSKKP
jgi:predicted nucleic acid-binding protein